MLKILGNQPPRKTTGYKSSKHSRKMITGVKKAIKKKNVKESAEISVGGGLNIGKKGILATSLLAACKAYSQYHKDPSLDVTQISSNSISSIIKDNKLSVPIEGRSILRSSISTALSSMKKDEK